MIHPIDLLSNELMFLLISKKHQFNSLNEGFIAINT